IGSHLILAIALNVLVTIVLLYLLERWLRKEGLSIGQRLILLLSTILLSSLPLLVISGMAFSLFLLLTFLFIIELLKTQPGRQLYIYALLLVATRYEGLLIVAAASLLLYRKATL